MSTTIVLLDYGPPRPGTGTLTVLCGAKLFRCCGEGPLVCAKERGHDGPHEDEGVVFG